MTRVAVTTAADTAGDVAREMADAGLEPVVLPCITVRPAPASVLARVRRRAASVDLILLTSARAVTTVWPEGGMPPTPVAAVGPATARAVEEAGGVVAVTGTGGAAELAHQVEASGKRIVFPHGRVANPVIAAELVRRGARVVAVPVYDTTPLAPGPDPVDAVVFGSPSAVKGWTRSRALDGLVGGAPGATTAAAVRDRGVDDPVVPSAPGYAEVAREIAERMRK